MSIIVTCSIITTYLQYSVITMSQEKPFLEMFSFQYLLYKELKIFLSQEILFWSTERKDDIQIDRPSEEKRRRNHVRTSKAFQTIEVLNVLSSIFPSFSLPRVRQRERVRELLNRAPPPLSSSLFLSPVYIPPRQCKVHFTDRSMTCPPAL